MNIIRQPIIKVAEYVQLAAAVVEAQLINEVGVVVALKHRRAQVESEAVALLADGLDADNSTHRGIVACTGVVDDLHVLYLVGVELLQLGIVAHEPAVDVHHRRALAQHLDGLALVYHTGNLAQHIVGRAQRGQHAVLHARHHGVALDLRLGQGALHHHLVE